MMMTCQHPGCGFKSNKRASITRHFKGTSASKTHTREELDLTYASGAEPTAADSEAPEAAAEAPEAAAEAPEAAELVVVGSKAVAPAASEPAAGSDAFATSVKTALTSLIQDDPGFRNVIIKEVVAELLKQGSFGEDFARVLAIEAPSCPRATFGKEPHAILQTNEADVRMWRGALSAASGVGLADLVAKKHVTIFKNVRASGDAATIEVYRGKQVWEAMKIEEAVKSMLARCEHDVLDLYESQDPVYCRYKTQVETFARTVGGKLGWDTSPYGCQHTEEADAEFAASIEAMIRESVGSSFCQ
jgi:hypothetical protein